MQKREVARPHHLAQTLSQNGYGDDCNILLIGAATSEFPQKQKVD